MTRSLLSLLLASAAGAQISEPLLVGGDYAGMLERYFTRQASLLLDQRDREVSELRTPQQIAARQQQIRARMLEQIGGLPATRTPLNARTTGGFERNGYRVENVVFESQPGFRVTANLYVPTRGQRPLPAVVGAAGHSANGKASATYQSAWIGFAKRGYVVLAFDPPGQGERLEFLDLETGKSRAGIGTAEHTMAGLQCLLTGHTFARYEIWDGIRAVDYLLSRPEVDGRRIAVAGNSGGGTQAAYLAVFEPRLAAVVSSCYMTGWRQLWSGPGPQDAEQVFPGFLRDGFDFGDFFLAAAPKPFLMTTAIRDFFPIEGARSTYRQTLLLFERLGASERAGYFEFDDTHGWSRPRREAAYRWLDKFLQDRQTDGAEGEIETEPESRLYATPTGQLANSLGSATVQSLNHAFARELASRRPPATLALIERRLELRLPRAAPRSEQKGGVEREGYRIDKLEFEVEPGLRIPGLFAVPAQRGPKPAILFASSWGKDTEFQAGSDLDELARAGHAVLALDPRGLGEGSIRRAGGGYSASYQTAARAWLTGRSLAAMQIEDLLHAFHWLREQPDVHPERIGIMSKGSAGPLALIAAALEPRLRKVAVERSLVSYMDVVAARVHEGLQHLIVPGILRDFDLPDVARLIAPRRLWMVSPVSPNGVPLLAAKVQTPHGQVIERPEGWSGRRVYADWLAD